MSKNKQKRKSERLQFVHAFGFLHSVCIRYAPITLSHAYCYHVSNRKMDVNKDQPVFFILECPNMLSSTYTQYLHALLSEAFQLLPRSPLPYHHRHHEDSTLRTSFKHTAPIPEAPLILSPLPHPQF